MGFNKYKSKYGDLVDEVDDLTMYGYKVSWTMASSICLVTIWDTILTSTPFISTLLK